MRGSSVGSWLLLGAAVMLAGCPGGGGGGGGGGSDGAAPADATPADSTAGDAEPDAALEPEPDAEADLDPDAAPGPDASAVDSGPDAGCVADCGAPPRIITFAANVRALTEGGQVAFSAVVTDPDGAADLLGGVLEDPSGAPYGPFIAAGEAGTYGFTLTWNDLHMVQPITFDGEGARTVVAAFFDQAGNRTAETIELTLHCRDAGGAACDGTCVSLDSPAHCGACDAACDTECRDRACACPGELTRCGDACVDADADVEHCGGCGRACPGLPDGAPICVRGDCRIQCAEELRLCGQAEQVCAPCPAEGVASTTCEGLTCVARTCADDHRLCDGGCARCPVDDAQATTCLGARCVATDCAPGSHPCAAGCCPWRGEPVGDAGLSYAFAVDGRGPHIVIGEDAQVTYRRWIDGEWVDEPAVVFEAPDRGPSDVDLALADGVLHLAFSVLGGRQPDGALPGRIDYRVGDADGWRALGGVDSPRPLAAPALALGDGSIWLAWRDGSVIWLLDVAGAGAPPAVLFDRLFIADPHVAVGSDGVVHAVSGRNGGGDLLYARRTPAGEIEAVDTGNRGLGGVGPRIALDRDGHPVIMHRSSLDEMYLTRFDGARWSTERILRGYQIIEGIDLTVGIDGRLIACAGTQLGLHVFEETDRGWRESEVADGDHRRCRMVVAPDGGHHVLASGPQGLTWYH